MTRALYVGRFQPFHKGHLETLKWILERCDEVIIGVGSAQYSHQLDNLFTAGERIEMIRRVLMSEGLTDRCLIIPIPDIGQHSLWVSVVRQFCPRFDVVYTNEPLTRRLFLEAGFKVEGIPRFNREFYDATRIRRLMAEGGDWESYVPSPAASFIKEIGGVERIKDLLRSDKVP
ncbi:MAG: nicotinamide-nucleotide adenylyltransferase [Thermoprotei archaeon]|nr:MAG: nicotinamide-nucleotide adenylyltransferase [Thermoprotei archaeon]RLF18888.1 MAG: nicotinamide-nucleotide adenylyltransferase [Thermoprotei archaeon]